MTNGDKNTQNYRFNVYFEPLVHRIAKSKAALVGKSISQYLEDLVKSDNPDSFKEPPQDEE